MVQHLTLNSFSLASPEKFNGVVHFFATIPAHVLIPVEILLIWIPLFFHAIYGMFIVGRAQPNYFGSVYGWSQNRMYVMQRWSGVYLFFFLMFHVISTTINSKINGEEVIQYAAWHNNLTSYGYMLLLAYMVGILAAAYHLGYGLWNFCIRWGITVGEKAQNTMQRVSFAAFIALTLLGWGALAGFLKSPGNSTVTVSRPAMIANR